MYQKKEQFKFLKKHFLESEKEFYFKIIFVKINKYVHIIKMDEKPYVMINENIYYYDYYFIRVM